MRLEEELKLLRAENSELKEQLRQALDLAATAINELQIAIKDRLTGLYDQKTLSRMLAEEVRIAFKEEKPLSLIVADIDNVKGINDYFGLPAGDFIISEVAQLVIRNVRPADLPARTGGNRITIVLPEATINEASQLATSLRKKVEAHQFSFKYPQKSEPHQIPVTISLGVASLNGDRPNEFCVGNLERDANWAVDAAKKKGRNCVAFSEGK